MSWFGKKRHLWINLSLILGGTLVGLLVFEIAARPLNLVFDSAHASKELLSSPTGRQEYQKDPELGYIPKMGPQYKYSTWGAKHNQHPREKRPGWLRVLFLGDSITDIGYTQDSLEKLCQDRPIEFWNCGVGGYSTFQELKYFQRYCSQAEPDLLVLNFYLNDFDGSPVVLKDEDDDFVFVTPYLGQEHFHPWWFKNSAVYRLFLSLKIMFSGRIGLTQDMKKSLQEFTAAAEREGFRFKVVVYPWLDRFDRWPAKHRQQYLDIIALLQELEIQHFNLKPFLESRLNNHPPEWTRVSNEDFVHPSREFCEQIARYLLAEGLLEDPGS